MDRNDNMKQLQITYLKCLKKIISHIRQIKLCNYCFYRYKYLPIQCNASSRTHIHTHSRTHTRSGLIQYTPMKHFAFGSICLQYRLHLQCMLYIVRHTLYDEDCTTQIVRHIVYDIHCTPYIVRHTYTTYIVRRILYDIYCTTYSVRHILYDIYCTIYDVRHTVHDIHCSTYINIYIQLISYSLNSPDIV